MSDIESIVKQAMSETLELAQKGGHYTMQEVARNAVRLAREADQAAKLDASLDGYHKIIDDKGLTRLSRMTQTEYNEWCNNSVTVETYGLRIVPKKDFGSSGYYDAKSRTNLYEGWVIIFTQGRFKGCNAMPGAVWSHTREDAERMIMAFIAVGGDINSDTVFEDKGFGDRFHALVRLTRKD